MVLALHFCRGREHVLTPDREEESVMNVITMVLPGSDSLIIIIGPGGLLLVVSPPTCNSQLYF
jgi:hypothetical protein